MSSAPEKIFPALSFVRFLFGKRAFFFPHYNSQLKMCSIFFSISPDKGCTLLLIFEMDADVYCKNPWTGFCGGVCVGFFPPGVAIMVKYCLSCSGSCCARLTWSFSSLALAVKSSQKSSFQHPQTTPWAHPENLLFWINCCFHVLLFLTVAMLSVCLFSFQITNWAFHLKYEGHYQGISS